MSRKRRARLISRAMRQDAESQRLETTVSVVQPSMEQAIRILELAVLTQNGNIIVTEDSVFGGGVSFTI